MALEDHFYRPIWRFVGDIREDHRNLFAPESLELLGLGMGMHAVFANTSLDEEIRQEVQRHAVNDPGAFDFWENMGEVWVVLPTLAGVWAIDCLMERHERLEGGWLQRHWDPRLGDWASQSLRALLVGAPTAGIVQVLIGASRPNESRGSQWRPFKDNNGVSGHAFVGSVPLLVAAKYTENRILKLGLIFCSMLPAYTRVYTDAHYFSQAALGWGIGCLAAEATAKTSRSPLQYRLVPLGFDGLVGIGVEFRM